MGKFEFIRNQKEESYTRFISFKGNNQRFDLAIIASPSLQEEKLVIDLNTNRYAKLNLNAIQNENNIEHDFRYNELEAEDFRKYIQLYVKD